MILPGLSIRDRKSKLHIFWDEAAEMTLNVDQGHWWRDGTMQYTTYHYFFWSVSPALLTTFPCEISQLHQWSNVRLWTVCVHRHNSGLISLILDPTDAATACKHWDFSCMPLKGKDHVRSSAYCNRRQLKGTRLQTIGNYLPADIVSAPSLAIFKQHLDSSVWTIIRLTTDLVTCPWSFAYGRINTVVNNNNIPSPSRQCTLRSDSSLSSFIK